jgi:hypothetical protein
MNKKTLLTGMVLFLLAASPAAALPLPEGFEHAIRQVQELVTTVKDFSALLYSAAAFVTKLLGFSAILLFIAVLVTSSGLVAVGIPAGKFPFLISLAFWDTMWILWTVSSGGVSAPFIGGFLLVNAKIAAPFALFEFFRLGVPFVYRAVLRRFAHGVSRSEAAGFAGNISRSAAEFSASLAGDLAFRSRRVVPSRQSLDSARELRDLCDGFLRASSRTAEDQLPPPAESEGQAGS